MSQATSHYLTLVKVCRPYVVILLETRVTMKVDYVLKL
jgi:hypothetical protein